MNKGVLRIHLCQILYNPAYYDNGFDLLEEPSPTSDSSHTLGHLREIDAVAEMLLESRASYIDHIKRKILQIATWSFNRKANILVFPEYSIPVEVLPDLFDLAKKNSALIIAGTHRIRLTDSSRKIYQSLGLVVDNSENGAAIAPIFLPNGSANLSFKRSRSKWEPGLNVGVERSDTHLVDIGGESIYIAIAPCIDSLQMDRLGAIWGNKDIKPNLLICPSLSPTTNMFHTVGQLVLTHEALFAFVNTTLFGGTGFNIPDEWKSYITGQLRYLEGLPAGSEGLLELDVLLNSFFIKKSSVVAEPPCTSIREFPIIYRWNNSWVDKYTELKKEIVELLSGNNITDAVEWIDAALSEQDTPFPAEIISKLKDIRYQNIPLFSGNIRNIEDCFEITMLEKETEDTHNLFAKRIAKSLDVTTNAIRSSPEKDVSALIPCLQVLKQAETKFGVPIQVLQDEKAIISVEETIDQFAYTPPETVLASFQNRGQKLDDLRDIIAKGSERIIVITGMPGIGKTELLMTLFLKVLIDWKPMWLNVAPGSSLGRIVAEFGNMLGIRMDSDSLSTVTDSVFRQKITKLFDILFSLEKRAIIIDDLKSIRGNTRDYHQLQSFIEEAARTKKFFGSRLFLISSVSSPPLWVQRAGVARLHLRGLEEVYSRRICEYQLRSSGLCSGETIPDIPQALLSLIDGHPLAAKIVAEASRKNGLRALANDVGLSGVATSLVDLLLPKLDLDVEEKKVAYMLSVFRLPVGSALIHHFLQEKSIRRLASRAIVDFDGNSYSMHPVVRRFFYSLIPKEDYLALHRIAVSYYDQMVIERKRHSNLSIDLELVHHLALAGNVKRLSELRANLYDEIFPAARQLYVQQQYDKAFELFMSLAEMRPNDPTIWAYVGRCFGRRGQWQDCDKAFERSLQAAEKTKQPTWWIHRDWGHILARFGFYSDAAQHLIDAKKASKRVDPSCIAAEAYISWKSGNIPEAIKSFEHVLKIDPNHAYTLSSYARLLDESGNKTYADELRKRLRAIENEMVSSPDFDIEDGTASGETE